jgi:hypothetical protein
MNIGLIHSKTEKLVIAILSIIIVVCNLILIFSYFFDGYYDNNFSHVYYSFRFKDIHYETLIIYWFSILALFVFAIKSSYIFYEKKIKNYFYPFSLPFFVFYLACFYPFYFYPFGEIFWVVLELVCLVLIFIYLINILVEHQYHTVNVDTCDKNLHIRFTHRDKLFLLVLSSICINCYILLTILQFRGFSLNYFSMLNASFTPYVKNFSNPYYDFNWILLPCQIFILYFLLKGFFVGIIKKLEDRFITLVIRIVAVILYLILYIPAFSFQLFKLDWQIIHLFGIVLMISMIYLTRDYVEKPFKILKYATENELHDKWLAFKKLEASLLYIAIFVGGVSFLLLALIDSLAEIPSTHITFNSSHIHSILSSVYDISWILLLCLCVLLYFSIKGLWLGYANKNSGIFIFNVAVLIIIIILIILYGPYIYYRGFLLGIVK